MKAVRFCLVLGLVACASNPSSMREPSIGSISIVYTRYGIPHITAGNWASLGYGVGYAAAEDHLCVLADAFVTFRGERSRYFGPSATQIWQTTLQYPTNLDADFFFRHIVSDALIARFRAEQPAKLIELTAGYAAGYSRYVREIRRGEHPGRHADCRATDWLSEISDSDVYRRMYTLSLTPGILSDISSIANARPQQGKEVADFQVPASESVVQLGSNGIGFGAQATGTRHGLLFGNPHWAWDGPERFHQIHMRIPGQLDVQGVAVLGVPMVMLGFNANVAWTHTVSTSKRFTPYRLKLVANDPTAYLYDGQVRRMTTHEVTVQVRGEDGRLGKVTRTLYLSHYGPMLDTNWTREQAVSIRDVSAENFRIFRTWLELAQAGSLDEFVAVQRRSVGLTFVNTIAVGRNDRRAWYGDIGTVPHVEDAMFATCNVGSRGILDGSRSECEWGNDSDSVQPGTFGASKLPSLFREDYVANMNDSPWLTNVHAPLSIHAPRIMGPTRYEQSLRTRMGHILIRDRLSGADGFGSTVTNESVRNFALNSRVLSAELFLDEVLTGICARPSEDIREACVILSRWDRRGDPQSVGAHIWEAFWQRAQTLRALDLYKVPFDAEAPLETPRDLKVENPRLAELFAASVQSLRDSPVPLSAARASYQYLTDTDGEHIPLAGGCADAGYFAVVCTRIGKTGPRTSSHGNTYMQVVGFTNNGVDAYTLFLPSQSTDPASPHYRDSTRAYSRKEWQRQPFTNDEVAAEAVTRKTLDPD